MRRFDLDTWEEILLTITRNKTRSFLTAFGIFWGIFMLISLMGGAKGLQQMLSRQFEGFATNSGFLGTNKTSKAYKGFQQGRYWDLENKDVERVRKQVSELETVTATLAKWGINAIYNENKISGTLKGLYPEYQKIEEPNIVFGRFINDIDIRDQRKVCVIGKRIYETLFPGGEDPCGKFIEVNGIYYRVIGVSMAVGNISIQGQSETSVIIPFSTMQQNYNFGQNVQLLCYTARKGYSIGEVEKKVEQVVKKAHLIHPDDGQAVILVNAEAMFSMVDNLFSGIRILGMDGRSRHPAGRSHRCKQHHDGHSKGANHRNRHTPRHRGTPERHSVADSFREYGTDHPGWYGRHFLCRLPVEPDRNGNLHPDLSHRISNQFLAGNRCLCSPPDFRTVSRTGSCLPGHEHQTH